MVQEKRPEFINISTAYHHYSSYLFLKKEKKEIYKYDVEKRVDETEIHR